MSVLSSKARWAVPAGLAVVVAGAVTAVAVSAGASPSLPPKSAGELLADLQQSDVTGLSGTVVQNSSLGLPELPTGATGSSSDLSSLVTGSHTLRVWYAGPQKVRLALLGGLGESDVIRNGQDLWVWESKANKASHSTLPAGVDKPAPLPTDLPTTPQQAAQQALDLLGPSTNVTTDGTASVAGRSAYELVLTPKDTRSLVGSVRIAVDAEKKVPLRVRVVPKSGGDPAFQVGFTQVSFSTPGDEQFRFTPPPGAKVTQQQLPTGEGRPSTLPGRPGGPVAGEHGVTTVGSGWTAVAVLPISERAGKANGRDQSGLDAIVGSLPKVSGAWGSGRVLSGTVFSAVITDDGRVAIGAVTPDLLYAALGQK